MSDTYLKEIKDSLEAKGICPTDTHMYEEVEFELKQIVEAYANQKVENAHKELEQVFNDNYKGLGWYSYGYKKAMSVVNSLTKDTSKGEK